MKVSDGYSKPVFILVWEGEGRGMRGIKKRRSAKKNSKEMNMFVIISVEFKVRNESTEVTE